MTEKLELENSNVWEKMDSSTKNILKATWFGIVSVFEKLDPKIKAMIWILVLSLSINISLIYPKESSIVSFIILLWIEFKDIFD